jgi:hypothetical protein
VEIVNDVVAFGAELIFFAIGYFNHLLCFLSDYASLLKAHSLLIKRVAYPLTFDNILPYFKDFDRLDSHANNVYVPAGGIILAPDVNDSVFGKGGSVHASAVITLSSFGTNAEIGE